MRPSEREPVSHTCPKVDAAILLAKRAVDAIEDVVVILNELREANGLLRDWGGEWKDYALKLESALSKLTEGVCDEDE